MKGSVVPLILVIFVACLMSSSAAAAVVYFSWDDVSKLLGFSSEPSSMAPKSFDSTIIAPISYSSSTPPETGGKILQPNINKKRNTVIGLFFHTWHNGVATKVMGEEQYPPKIEVYWWGRPSYENGDVSQYIWKEDGKLARYQLDLVEDLGVDFLYVDLTNGTQPEILHGTRILCRVRQERKKGPRIVLWCKFKEDVALMAQEFYKKYDPDIFFSWKGKPLIMINGMSDGWVPNGVSKPIPQGGVFDQYTIRWCWGLMGSNSHTMWNFKELDPDRKPYTIDGKPEQMSVAFASQATYMTTVGDGRRCRENGKFFEEQKRAVDKHKPAIVCIHSWNEWSAINFSNVSNQPQFVDMYGQECSADVEPMKGGHGDRYYRMAKAFIDSLP